MQLLEIIGKLETTPLTRRVVATKSNRGEVISYHNETGDVLKAVVNSIDYNELIQICLTDTFLYINNMARRSLNKIEFTEITSLEVI